MILNEKLKYFRILTVDINGFKQNVFTYYHRNKREWEFRWYKNNIITSKNSFSIYVKEKEIENKMHEISIEDLVKSIIIEAPNGGSIPPSPPENTHGDDDDGEDMNEISGKEYVEKEFKGYTKEQIQKGTKDCGLRTSSTREGAIKVLQGVPKKTVQKIKEAMGEPKDGRVTQGNTGGNGSNNNQPHTHPEYALKDHEHPNKHAHDEYITNKDADTIIKKRIEEIYPPQKTIVVNKPKNIKLEFGEDEHVHEAFEKVLQLANARKNIMLTGPAGCGKTHLGGQVARALGLEFGHVSCSMGMSESQLAGWLLPIGEAGKFEYVPAPFVKLYKNGGLFLLDEFDNADPNLAVFFNTAIANGEISIPQNIGENVVKKHPDFVCVAAANTFGNGPDAIYVGRNQLDAATLDRFRCGIIEMDYDPKVEHAIVDKDVLTWGVSIREKIRSNRLRRIMSTRFLKDMTDMKLAYKWQQKDWEQVYFADWTEDERKKVG